MLLIDVVDVSQTVFTYYRWLTAREMRQLHCHVQCRDVLFETSKC